MSIDSKEDLEGLIRVGRIVALVLREMEAALRPGITTAELDRVGAAVAGRHGARSAPQLVYDFPGVTCISLNDEAVHGIPGERRVEPGDLVKIDVTLELGGYVADAAVTVPLPPVSALARRLTDCAAAAFHRASAAARPGRPVNEVGRTLDAEVRRHGFRVLRELHGHGVGRSVHEPPSIPQYFEPRMREPLTRGMVITIEPIISVAQTHVVDDPDGWTLRTADGSLSAHYEHTIVIADGRPLILTAA